MGFYDALLLDLLGVTGPWVLLCLGRIESAVDFKMYWHLKLICGIYVHIAVQQYLGMVERHWKAPSKRYQR